MRRLFPLMQYAELHRLYHLPLFDLLTRARAVHEKHWPKREIQLCTLLSIKTGGCSEDCSYCAQSSRYQTEVEREALMSKEGVLVRARMAKENGSTRFCMGAAWKGVQMGTPKFEQVLDIVRDVAKLNLEVCVTLGEIGSAEAEALKEAGVTAYNHNIDTSPEHYPNIVTSHTFQDRVDTCKLVRQHGMELCSGVLLGMGESIDQRLELLGQLREIEPTEVPVNFLKPMAGTPFAHLPAVEPLEALRWIAVFRLALPTVILRYAGGREFTLGDLQAMGMTSGINALIIGNYLTYLGRSPQEDLKMLEDLRMPVGALTKVL